jgi:hypothetical protein
MLPAQVIERSSQQVLLESLYEDAFVNDCYERMRDGDVFGSMNDLLWGMNERQLASSIPEWKGFVDFCMLHPICELLYQDPITRRAFEKPRGYAGDAVLLDYIYKVREPNHSEHDFGRLGRDLFSYSLQTNACRGVRARAAHIAALVDEVAAETPRPDILSVAAGHLREADHSQALRCKNIGSWVALDSDVDSLDETRRCYAKHGVTTEAASVRKLLAGRAQLGQFDLIYSTGLYDYLQQPLARRLTARLFQMLRPGGRLLLANFLTGSPSRGYMDSFMNWVLIYRNEEEMKDLVSEIDPAQVAEKSLDVEDQRHIIFLLLRKC